MSIDSEPAVRGRQSPAFSINDALSLLSKAYDELRFAGPFDRDTLSKALGHESPRSGAVGVKIGSLTHFGLIDTGSGGTYKITELAMRYLHPSDEVERLSAIRDAVKIPAIYTDLIRDFGGKTVPPMLSHLLVRTYGVVARNSELVAKLFRESMEQAGLLRNGILHDDFVPPASQSHSAERSTTNATTQEPTGSNTEIIQEKTKSAPEKTTGYTIPLKGGRVVVLDIPVPISPQDVDRIKGWLDLMREPLTEQE